MCPLFTYYFRTPLQVLFHQLDSHALCARCPLQQIEHGLRSVAVSVFALGLTQLSKLQLVVTKEV